MLPRGQQKICCTHNRFIHFSVHLYIGSEWNLQSPCIRYQLDTYNNVTRDCSRYYFNHVTENVTSMRRIGRSLLRFKAVEKCRWALFLAFTFMPCK